MWTIRQEQTDAFRQHHLQGFEDEMAVHLQKFAPRHWKVIGEPTGRQVIRLGIEKAGKYGFINRGPVRFYIELMFMFGSYFDTDPQYPWASAVLNDSEIMDQRTRADHLYGALNDYLLTVPGPEYKYYFQALQRLSETDLAKVGQSMVPPKDTAAREFKRIYPQAWDYLGEETARRAIEQGFATANKYEFTSVKGMLLMAALAVFMGHRFSDDPLCGWIARRLDTKRFPSPSKRSDELHKTATLYIKRVLEERAKA